MKIIPPYDSRMITGARVILLKLYISCERFAGSGLGPAIKR
nr:hypothetical protein [Maribellus comscasis]